MRSRLHGRLKSSARGQEVNPLGCPGLGSDLEGTSEPAHSVRRRAGGSRALVFPAAGCVGGEEDADRFVGEPVPLGGRGALAGVELRPVLRYGQGEVGEVRGGEAGVGGGEQAALDVGIQGIRDDLDGAGGGLFEVGPREVGEPFGFGDDQPPQGEDMRLSTPSMYRRARSVRTVRSSACEAALVLRRTEVMSVMIASESPVTPSTMSRNSCSLSANCF